MDFCKYLSEIGNITPQCATKDGWEQVGYIINRSDIDYAAIKYGYKTDYPNTVVTQFAAKDGKKGYFVGQLKNAFTDSQVNLNVGDYRNTFTNQVHFTAFGNSVGLSKVINGLANGEFVMILEQKEKGENGESAYRIFGLDNGLTATEITNNPTDDSIGNSWNIVLEETGASSSEYFLFISTGEDVDPTAEATKQCIDTIFEQPA